MARSSTPKNPAARRSTTASRGGSRSSSRTSASRQRRAPARASKVATSRRTARPRLWMPGIVLGVVVVLAWTMYPALRLQYQTGRRMAGLRQQYESLKDRNATLKREVAELKTPSGVEKAARSSLGFTRSGEHVYIVMPEGGEADSATRTVAAEPARRTAVQVVLDALFGVAPPASENVEP